MCEFCSIKSGGTPARSKKEYWENGNIPWVKISDFTGKYLSSTEEYITAKGLECSSAKVFSRGTLLYTIFATLGEVCILNIDATTNQAIAGIVIENNAVEKEYLYYFLTSLKEKINRIGRGVAQNNINISILRNIEVPILERSKQKNIADILNHIDSLISKRRQQLASLDLLVKARFVEMFGTYQANEKSWITGTIRDVVSEVRYGSSRPAVDGGDYPYLRMNNITYDGELDLSDTKRIDIPDNELEKCTVRRGDVLFNRTNSKELVGKTCVYNRDEMMVLAGFVIRVRVNDKVLPEFLSAFLNTDFSKHMLLGMCKTAIGQANINAQEMQNIGLYIPPIDLQRQFVDVKMQIDKAKLAVQKSLQELETLKKALLQQYFG